MAVTDNDAGVTPALPASSGDTNDNGLLDPSETWVYTASGTAVAGQYGNVGTVTGTGRQRQPATHRHRPTTPTTTSATPPAINIVKLTNGTDNDTRAPGPPCPSAAR